MKPLVRFSSQFGAKIALNSEFVVERSQRYYLVNDKLKKLARGNFYAAGLYLGKIKNGVFFPSFNLLNMLVDVAANKVVVDKKAAWLFICGRDIFRSGVLHVYGSRRKGAFTLVLNNFGECLGFGRIIHSLDDEEANVVVRNVLDLGDFLRREK
ncbi:MAG: hypothetical protein ACQXXJ_03475 [Candidatus Bathyarchaeia archaeon]